MLLLTSRMLVCCNAVLVCALSLPSSVVASCRDVSFLSDEYINSVVTASLAGRSVEMCRFLSGS
jgi:hypothetical protein